MNFITKSLSSRSFLAEETAGFFVMNLFRYGESDG